LENTASRTTAMTTHRTMFLVRSFKLRLPDAPMAGRSRTWTAADRA
jgi:hypothetical protein